MSVEKILSDWKKNLYKPVYWLQGEEEYYIDQVMQYAEHKILPESEAAFNLTVFYGKDAVWSEVINACRRYPMFAERQVVLLKEGQQMKDILLLESYIANPLPSTVFVVSYKGKKVDARTTFSKELKKNAEILTTEKIYESQLPTWTREMIASRGYTIAPRALSLLVDHIGNDLSRIVNEFNKVIMNVGEGKEITEDDIEQFVGISKEYNVFALQEAISSKNLAKAVTIIQYFDSNPKAGPIQMVLPALYSYFSKIITIFQMADKSEKALKPLFSFNSFAVKQAQETVLNFNYEGVEKILLLLHEYNLKSVGVHDSGTGSGSLMKEMAAKMIVG